MRFVRRGGGGPAQEATPLGSSYMLHELLGRGGMGQVWLGSIRTTGEAVAVKVLNPEYGSDPEVVSRFLQERSILMGLHSPHLVGVRDLVAEGETLAIVMDLIQGGDLRKYLASSGPVLAPAFAAGLTAQVLTGLATVHASGIVHRDLKPENVLLDRGGEGDLPVCRLSDFGIARLTTRPGLTKTTGLIGTPEYMAPELADQESPGPAADLYAAGVMLYEFVAGRTPFAGGTAVAVLRRHMDDEPARPEVVPDPLWELISELLAKRPELRPSAAEGAERLVTMIPRLLAAASPGEGAEGPDPNVTLLPGYQAARPTGEALSTGRMRVPLPITADRPRGNEQVTILPGRSPAAASSALSVPAAFRVPAAKPATPRRTLAIGAAVVGVLLVMLVGIGVVVRPGSGSGGTAHTSPTSSLPASGHLNNGLYDLHFNEAKATDPFTAKSTNLRMTELSNPVVAESGQGSYLQMVSPTSAGAIIRTISVTLDPARNYTFSMDARSESNVEILGTIDVVAFGDSSTNVLHSFHTPFCVHNEWTHLPTTSFIGNERARGLTVLIRYVTSPPTAGVPFDVTNVEYTYASQPATRDPAATPTAKC